ncbi:MAG: 30S ribosomal protein S20 [Verrucomicrobiota bacterium]
MANTKSAAKRARVSERRRGINRSATSKARTAVKKVKSSVTEGEQQKATESLPKAYSAIDKAVKLGSIHRNKASRMKSRLSKAVAVKS